MPFPFTFKLSTSFPAPNPFLDGKLDAKFAGANVNHDADPLNLTRKFPQSRSVPSTTTTDDWPRSRKRSRAGERIGTTEKVKNNNSVFHGRPTTGLTLAQGAGYLDTPAKYRNELNMGASRSRIWDHRQAQIDEDDEELMQEPPTKRRRGLAGSIVSTALSAALIGTAVGLTVYRLWRDRGKDEIEEREPPPPYTASSHQTVEQPQITHTSPSSSTTHFHATKKPQRKIVPKRRRKMQPSTSMPVHRPQPEFDFASAMDTTGDGEFGEGSVDEHISSLSNKLNLLIEEGRKALGREIVIDGDDSEGPWQDEDEDNHVRSSSRSPRKRARERSSTLTRDVSYRSGLSASVSTTISISKAANETSDTWEGSPQLGEEMKRARERVLAQRGRAI